MSKRSLILALALILVFGTSDALAQMREVRGTVTSVSGEAVAGAIVTVKGTTIAALTLEDGSYTIIVPAGDVTLTISFLGYRTSEVDVGTNQNTANISLELDPLRLEEIVVTGQATGISRLNLPNAVSTVSAEEIERSPVESLDKALQGKVAGANIEQNSGAPGGGVQVRLRGVSTVNGLSKPLYVVDGVLISDEEIPSNQNAVTQASGGSNPALTQDATVNRVADINPSDIEKIEVLKGASAAAIYGQKASNGVIIITTKRGRPGRARVRFSQSFGTFDLQNTLGFRNWTLDQATTAFGDSAGGLAIADFFDASGRPLQTFDQEELLAGRNDLATQSNLSVSGGSARTQYFASATWKKDQGIIDNTGFERQALRLNLDQQVGSNISMQFNTNLLHTVARRGLTNNDNSGTSFYMVFPFTPNFVDLRAKSGVFPDNPFERSNPLQTAALMSNDEDVWRLIGALNFEWDAIRGSRHNLRVLANGGADYFAQKNELFFPPDLQFERQGGQPGTSLLSNSDNLNYNVGANLVYSFTPASGSFTATTSGGVMFERRDLQINRMVANNLNAGLQRIPAGTSIQVESISRLTKDLGYFLQQSILFNDRLLLSVGGRLDRSSNNGNTALNYFYPKAAASYRWTDLTGWLTEFKLRGAWGQSGNLPLFGQKFTPLAVTFNVEQIPGVVLADTIGDAAVKPERQNEFEVGFDAQTGNGRGSFEFTVYQKNISDLLLAREIAPSTGFTAQTLNGGKLRVRGVEASLGATLVQNSSTNWLFRTTFFLDRNKITDLPVPTFRAGGFGTALGAFQIEEGASATQIVAVVSDADSSFVAKVGDATPDFKWAFVNDVTLGNFNIYALFDWQQGGDLINLTKLLFDFGQNTVDYLDDPQNVVNIGPACAVELPDGSCDPAGAELTLGERRILGFGVETRPFVESATFVKLRELSVSYTLSQNVTRSLFGSVVNNLRISLIGRNLITWTGYDGLDPEVSNFGNQAVGRNIDVAPFPPSRSYWLTFDFDF